MEQYENYGVEDEVSKAETQEPNIRSCRRPAATHRRVCVLSQEGIVLVCFVFLKLGQAYFSHIPSLPSSSTSSPRLLVLSRGPPKLNTTGFGKPFILCSPELKLTQQATGRLTLTGSSYLLHVALRKSAATHHTTYAKIPPIGYESRYA